MLEKIYEQLVDLCNEESRKAENETSDTVDCLVARAKASAFAKAAFVIANSMLEETNENS